MVHHIFWLRRSLSDPMPRNGKFVIEKMSTDGGLPQIFRCFPLSISYIRSVVTLSSTTNVI